MQHNTQSKLPTRNLFCQTQATEQCTNKWVSQFPLNLTGWMQHSLWVAWCFSRYQPDKQLSIWVYAIVYSST